MYVYTCRENTGECCMHLLLTTVAMLLLNKLNKEIVVVDAVVVNF